MTIPMYKKKAVGADRSRKKIYTPSECLIPKIENGFVFVHPKKRATVRILERKGFVQVEAAPVIKKAKAPAKPKPFVEKPKVKSKLYEKTVKELKKIAAELDIPGRSSMNEAELVSAIQKSRS